MAEPEDAHIRRECLHPEESFIVQAPAGSGKTELLIQRYLRLLGKVKKPEEILAMTFTRKAAAEMRGRILSALQQAATPSPLSGELPEHKRLTRELAAAVVKRDRELGWNLQENPNRLRIQTIDSFCFYLSAQMPLLSGFGKRPEVVENGHVLYAQAAVNTLMELTGREDRPELARVLRHVDNDWNRLTELIAVMLSRREHWMEILKAADGDETIRELLQRELESQVQGMLARVSHLIEGLDPSLRDRLLRLYNYSSQNLDMPGAGNFPGPSAAQVQEWQKWRRFFLTESGSWRKQVNVKQGFPPPKDLTSGEEKDRAREYKQEYSRMLAELADNQTLRQALHTLKNLPDTEYMDADWELLVALIRVLKRSLAHLYLVMQAEGKVDYTQVTEFALDSLGTPENPTDLLLKLDYRINHLLVDEYQDTSLVQQRIITTLVSGWQPGDGRTIFLVGDPMQSIYGFRNAEVGIFQNCRAYGIADVHPRPRYLTVNFRSGQEVVEWVNKVFPGVFQFSEDPVTGAVRYSAMQKYNLGNGAVGLYLLPETGGRAEAQKALEIIRDTRREDPEGSIAVLVRSRSHLREISRLLDREGIGFQAVDIEPLQERQPVLDLFSLVRALAHPADDLAWFSVLRAPWTGLDLADLTRIAEKCAKSGSVLDVLAGGEFSFLSPQGAQRLRRAAPVLVQGVLERGRRRMSRLLETVWLNLGGPACLEEDRDRLDADNFLKHLQGLEQNGDIPDFSRLEDSLGDLYSQPRITTGNPVSLMTVHKSKGLEFDTVIIPGMHRIGRSGAKELVQMMEVSETGKSEPGFRFLLAPLNAPGEKDNPVYTYIREIKKQKKDNELGRLLYVAATRARKNLHLLAEFDLNEQEKLAKGNIGKKDSFLGRIEESFVAEAELCPFYGEGKETGEDRKETNRLRYLSPDWGRPEINGGLSPGSLSEYGEPPSSGSEEEGGLYDFRRHVGSVVHEFLQAMGREKADEWSAARIKGLEGRIAKRLATLGVPGTKMDESVSMVKKALENTVSDPVGKWILRPRESARCEYGLTGVVEGRLVSAIIDRTFVDEEGIRWIVDYKTSVPRGDQEEFIRGEVGRYQEQLAAYARLMREMEPKAAVKTGLYFPMISAWREV